MERPVLLVTPPHDILVASRKYKMGRNIINMIIDDPPDCQACVYYDEKRPRCVLWIKKGSLRTYVHETNHIIDHMMEQIGAVGEKEFTAYSQEWLWARVKKELSSMTSHY